MSDANAAASAQTFHPAFLAIEIVDLINGKQIPSVHRTKVLDAMLMAYLSMADAKGLLDLAGQVMCDEGVRILKHARERRMRLAVTTSTPGTADSEIAGKRGVVVIDDVAAHTDEAIPASLISHERH